LFGLDENSTEEPELELNKDERRYVAVIASLSIAAIWLYEGIASHALPMSAQSALQGAILLSVPYLFLAGSLLISADRAIAIVSISFALLAVSWFPFVAFVSWFVSYRPGPVALLCPINAMLWIPAVAMWRRNSKKLLTFGWALFWSLPLGYYIYYGMLVWLQEKWLYVSPPR